MTAAETQAALAFLRDAHLIERIMADVERVGAVRLLRRSSRRPPAPAWRPTARRA
jgi:hypothetical protein